MLGIGIEDNGADLFNKIEQLGKYDLLVYGFVFYNIKTILSSI